MKNPDYFSYYPLGHVQHTQGVHMVWVNITTNVADAPAISDVVECDQYAGDKQP